MSDCHNGEEAYRLAAWLQEGAWSKMTLGDVEKAGRLLIKLQERLVSLEKEYDESMAHQNNQYNRRVAERDAALAEVDRLKAEIFTYQRSFSAFKEDVEKSPKQRTGNCLLTGVCASEGHRITRSSQDSITDDYERAAFEAWIAKDGGDLRKFGRGLNTHYSNDAVNNAWTGWKQRAHGITKGTPT